MPCRRMLNAEISFFNSDIGFFLIRLQDNPYTFWARPSLTKKQILESMNVRLAKISWGSRASHKNLTGAL